MPKGRQTEQCSWDSELDVQDPAISHVYHKTGFSEIEAATTKLMNRLFLDQQKRIAKKADFDDSRGDSGRLLVSRLERVSKLLDTYYSSDSRPLGILHLQDLSLGTHRTRQEADQYITGLSHTTKSFGKDGSTRPPNFPVPLAALREAKRSHNLFKQRLKSPWWHRALDDGSGLLDEELNHICSSENDPTGKHDF